MIKVYEKNGLFIIQDTIIDIIYPNLTKQEAINLLIELGRTSDRVDNAIKDFNENNFQYESLEVDKTRLKYLEQQLAEKDKEIAELKERVIEEEDFKLAYKHDLGQVRKQVCDEIRDKLKTHCNWANGNYTGWYIPETKIDLILDKIEKGTNKNE